MWRQKSEEKKWPGSVSTVNTPVRQTFTPTTAWTSSTTTPAPTTTTRTTAAPYQQWSTPASKRVATKQSVLAAPSDPTKPLTETATFSSNHWPSQFNSNFGNHNINNINNNFGVENLSSRPKDRKLIEERDEIMNKNYFFTPSPTPLHVRDEKLKKMNLPSFQSEFTAFNDQQRSSFDNFDTNFKTDFADTRLKKEVKNTDRTFSTSTSHGYTNGNSYDRPSSSKSFSNGYDRSSSRGYERSSSSAGNQDTYYHHGHHDSSAFASAADKSSVSGDDEQDIVQLYIPDPLAPGHPMGNGNHGWAPIEEWARGHIQGALDSPDWATSQVFSSQSKLFPDQTHVREALNSPAWSNSQVFPGASDWSDKVTPAPKIYESSTPASYRSPTVRSYPSPTARSYPSPTARSYPSPTPRIYPSPTPTVYKSVSPSSYNSPTPSPYKSPSPTPSDYQSSSSTIATVAPVEVSTMRYPSPVTPLYHTNFGDYASLDMKHQSGPTGPPGLPLFNTISPQHGDKYPQHSNSHYMQQNPFIVSPVPTVSVTAATAAAIKRNDIDSVKDFYKYNPVTQTSLVREHNPYARYDTYIHS